MAPTRVGGELVDLIGPNGCEGGLLSSGIFRDVCGMGTDVGAYPTSRRDSEPRSLRYRSLK